ncbi:MAG: hypothetical protein AAFP19_09185 [Bacteroidota bacterium]
MKKLMLLAWMLLLSTGGFAQVDEGEWQEGMEELQLQMQDMMKGLEKELGGMNIYIDTLFFQDFGDAPMEGGSPMPLDSLQTESLFDQLQKELEAIPAEEWAQLRSMMKEFGWELPEDGQTPGGGEAPADQKKTKKRKVYSL